MGKWTSVDNKIPAYMYMYIYLYNDMSVTLEKHECTCTHHSFTSIISLFQSFSKFIVASIPAHSCHICPGHSPDPTIPLIHHLSQTVLVIRVAGVHLREGKRRRRENTEGWIQRGREGKKVGGKERGREGERAEGGKDRDIHSYYSAAHSW